MISAYQASSQARVNAALEPLFVAPSPEMTRLYEAMRYSVMNGGKACAPVAGRAACEALGAPAAEANGAACAVELIHAYSLVHDDLPAMDDDDLRRGQPTTHKAFDEAYAILAGDGLQSLAFSALLDPTLGSVNAEIRLRMVTALAHAAGPGWHGRRASHRHGLGQPQAGSKALEHMHAHKTGALIEAAVQLGALASGRAGAEQWRPCRPTPALSAWPSRCRTIFSTWKVIPPPSANAKAPISHGTSRLILHCWGCKPPRRGAVELRDQALDALQTFDAAAEPLRDLARYIVERRH